MPKVPVKKGAAKKFVPKKAGPRKVICIACGDTGKSSKGGACHPCTVRKRNA